LKREPSPQALCRSCGLCCDGTLFTRVSLKPPDLLPPLQAAGIRILDGDESQYFPQPCAAFRECRCIVYDDRPAACRKYRCELLKNFESGSLSWDEAQERIGRVQELRALLRSELATLVPGAERLSVEAMRGLAPPPAELAENSERMKTWAPVLLHLSVLVQSLQTEFQPRPAPPKGA
jgi:hypothetical protein